MGGVEGAMGRSESDEEGAREGERERVGKSKR